VLILGATVDVVENPAGKSTTSEASEVLKVGTGGETTT